MEAFLTDGRDIRSLVGPRLCAVGTGTAARLNTFKNTCRFGAKRVHGSGSAGSLTDTGDR